MFGPVLFKPQSFWQKRSSKNFLSFRLSVLVRLADSTVVYHTAPHCSLAARLRSTSINSRNWHGEMRWDEMTAQQKMRRDASLRASGGELFVLFLPAEARSLSSRGRFFSPAESTTNALSYERRDANQHSLSLLYFGEFSSFNISCWLKNRPQASMDQRPWLSHFHEGAADLGLHLGWEFGFQKWIILENIEHQRVTSNKSLIAVIF